MIRIRSAIGIYTALLAFLSFVTAQSTTVTTGTTTTTTEDCYTVLKGTYAAVCNATACVEFVPTTIPLPPPTFSTTTAVSAYTVTQYVTLVEQGTQTVNAPATTVAQETVYTTVAVLTIDNTVTTVVAYTTTVTDIVNAVETATVTTTPPVTLTYTETSTFVVTLCESRITNTAYTASVPVPTDHTWGCPPGYVCKPEQVECNFESGVPDMGYSCSPDQCVPITVFSSDTYWGTPVYSNSSPLTDPSLRYDIIDHYFNTDPSAFNLDYQIFFEQVVSTFTTTIFPQPSAAPKARQAQTFIPGPCYDECNDAQLEAQQTGKTPALCLPGSAFEITLNYCQKCIQVHGTDASSAFVAIQPQFQQFLDYCAVVAASVTVTSTPITTLTQSLKGPTSTLTIAGLGSATSLVSETTLYVPSVSNGVIVGVPVSTIISDIANTQLPTIGPSASAAATGPTTIHSTDSTISGLVSSSSAPSPSVAANSAGLSSATSSSGTGKPAGFGMSTTGGSTPSSMSGSSSGVSVSSSVTGTAPSGATSSTAGSGAPSGAGASQSSSGSSITPAAFAGSAINLVAPDGLVLLLALFLVL